MPVEQQKSQWMVCWCVHPIIKPQTFKGIDQDSKSCPALLLLIRGRLKRAENVGFRGKLSRKSGGRGLFLGSILLARMLAFRLACKLS